MFSQILIEDFSKEPFPISHSHFSIASALCHAEAGEMALTFKDMRPAVSSDIDHTAIALLIYFDGVVFILKSLRCRSIALSVALLSMNSTVLFLFSSHVYSSSVRVIGIFKYSKTLAREQENF